MPAFKRIAGKMLCTGIDLRHPVDLLPPGKFPALTNVRADQQGSLTVRKTLSNISGSALGNPSIHSVRRLNNSLLLYPSGGSAILPYTNILGANDALYAGQTGVNLLEGGYSGDPLSLVPCQPTGGQDAWMYVSDRSRSQKVRGDTGQTHYAIGIAPPTTASSIAYGIPVYTTIASGASAFTASGTAGGPSTPNRISTTIAAILYDSGSTGWACVAPTAITAAFQPGTLINTNSAEVVRIRDCFPAIDTTTIARIAYDSGTSGLCTITLTTNSSGLKPDAMIRIAAAEYVRVLSVTTGADENYTSFRCSTASTRSAGNAVTGVQSYRAYHFGTFAATNTITSPSNHSSITVGTGILTLVGALDLSVAGARPITQDDYIHISVKVDKPEQVVEGKFLLDIDASTNDFTQNYFYKAFRAADLQTNVSNLLTVPSAQQVAVQRQVLGDNTLDQPLDPNQPAPTDIVGENVPSDGGQGISTGGEAPPSSIQQVTGSSQWSELVIKVSELTRVGSDQTRSLANVASIRVQLQVSATTILDFGSWWIGGTFGRDSTNIDSPLLYTYRYRSSLTGAVSNPAPVVRSGLTPKREYTTVSYTASSDTQVDQIEIFSFGAGLDEWRKVLQVPNASSFAADTLDTLAIATNTLLEFDNYQPFPTTDIPRTGGCSVCGTTITWASGDTFNTSWAPGSSIIVNNIATTIYSVPSTTVLWVTDSLGTSASTTFTLPGATLQATPLPAMWGPFGGTDIGLYNFACGDPNDPGLLYWTKANNPDAASDKGFKSVTSPSEPLMNGFSVDGRNILFSSDRVFNVVQSLSGPNQFTTQEMINGTGLFSRWAFCFKGTKFWYLSKSGIYKGSLDSIDPLQPITDDDLYPLFPHEGAPPLPDPINGYYPIDFTQTQKLRLSCDEDSVFFNYQDTTGTQRCLRYDLALKGWFPEDYTPQPLTIYKAEGEGVEQVLAGCNNGILYSLITGYSDAGTAVSCSITTPALDDGDSRAQKYFGDIMLDYNSTTETVSVLPKFNNLSITPDAATPVSNAARSQSQIDIQSGAGYLALNISAVISWSSSTLRPTIFEWQPSYVLKPELSLKRATDWDDAGTPGDKYVRAVLIEADTLGQTRTAQVLGDGGTVNDTLSILASSTQQLIPYAITPFNAHLMKLQPTDADPWQLFRAVWIFDPYPELASITGKWTDAGYPGDKWVQGIRLRADTAGVGVTFNIQGDGGVTQASVLGGFSGETVRPYSWTPFMAHLLRIVPTGAARVWEESEFVYEPMPELTDHWITQITSHDFSGWQPLRDLYITLLSQGTVTLLITTEMGSASFDIPSTSNVYTKVYINQMYPTPGHTQTYPIKGKIWTYSLTGGPFRLFLKDCEVSMKQWGSSGPYAPMRPFGDVSRTNGGARI